MIGSGRKQQLQLQPPSEWMLSPLLCVYVPRTTLLHWMPVCFPVSFPLAYLNMVSSLPSASKNQGESTLLPQCPLAFSWNAEGRMPILLVAMWLWAGVYQFLGPHLYNRL